MQVTCDVCDRRDAETYFVTIPGERRRQVDLCPEHGAPLRELAIIGHEKRGARRIATMDEVMSQKSQRRRR